MGQTNVFGTVMLTGQVTLQIESQPQVTFSCLVVDQSQGAEVCTAEVEFVALSGKSACS